MAIDARIAVTLPQHPKTKKLIKRLGQAAAWNLVCLFLWAAANRSDGDLTGLSDEDIELAADWSGDDGAFVAALLEVRFLDDGGGGYLLHDWRDHNPWADGAGMRSVKARWNAIKKHHGAAEADRQVPEYAAIRNAGSNPDSTQTADVQHASGMLVADAQHAGRSAPSPSPSQQPSRDGRVRTPKPQARAVDNSTSGEVVRQLAAAGIPGVGASHPELLALIDRGASVAMFADAAAKSVAKGKGFRYLLGVIDGQLADAACLAQGAVVGQRPWDADRTTVEAEGERVGLGRWCGNPVTELFSVYTERVRQAREREEEVV